jgi:hypothetical protein
MLAELGLSEEEWSQTPPAARAALTLLWQQNRMLQSRCAAYEAQIERLQAQVIELEKLRLEVAEFTSTGVIAVLKPARRCPEGTCFRVLKFFSCYLSKRKPRSFSKSWSSL